MGTSQDVRRCLGLLLEGCWHELHQVRERDDGDRQGMHQGRASEAEDDEGRRRELHPATVGGRRRKGYCGNHTATRLRKVTSVRVELREGFPRCGCSVAWNAHRSLEHSIRLTDCTAKCRMRGTAGSALATPIWPITMPRR